MSPETHRIINRAIELIEQGWCQGSLFGNSGDPNSCCLVGALHRARVEQGPGGLLKPCEKAIKQHLGLGVDVTLGKWNDAPGRTQAEVVAVLRAVAKEGGEG